MSKKNSITIYVRNTPKGWTLTSCVLDRKEIVEDVDFKAPTMLDLAKKIVSLLKLHRCDVDSCEFDVNVIDEEDAGFIKNYLENPSVRIKAQRMIDDVF